MSEAISLKKGQNISLKKVAPALKEMIVGLGWKENSFDGADFDLDASAIMLGENGKVIDSNSVDGFIFYGNPESKCGSIKSTGDNQTGDAEGDDEQLIVDPSKIPANIKKVVFVVSIYEPKTRNQNFGMVDEAYIRLVDSRKLDSLLGGKKAEEFNSQELEEAYVKASVLKFDLTEKYSTETAMVFAELYMHENEWKFKAVGQGFNNGLGGVGRNYGLPLKDEE